MGIILGCTRAKVARAQVSRSVHKGTGYDLPVGGLIAVTELVTGAASDSASAGILRRARINCVADQRVAQL